MGDVVYLSERMERLNAKSVVSPTKPVTRLEEFDAQYPPVRVFPCFHGGSPFRCKNTITVSLPESQRMDVYAVRCAQHQQDHTQAMSEPPTTKE